MQRLDRELTARSGITELSSDEVDALGGGTLSAEGGVGIGLGLIGIGLAIAAGPIGIFGAIVAGASSGGGGVMVGHYLVELF